MKKPSHILVIRLSALGDVAMTIPVLRVVVQTHPEIHFTVLSRPFYRSLFVDIENVHFLAAEVETTHKNFGLLKLGKEIKAFEVDAIADLHNVLRSKILRNYITLKDRLLVAKVVKGRSEKKRLTKANPYKKLQKLKSTHQRYADVFGKLGFPINLEQHQFPTSKKLTSTLHDFIGKHTRKLIGIAPFAAHEGKMYPLDMMTQVIFDIAKTGKFEIFLFGSKDEAKQLQEIGGGQEFVKIVAGNFSFEEELTLISNLDGMVAMDSGNGHLAAMYGVPVITLWGVTHPYLGFTPFMQPNENQLISNRNLYPLIPTSVYGNKHPESYRDCMKSIPVDLVVDKITTIF